MSEFSGDDLASFILGQLFMYVVMSMGRFYDQNISAYDFMEKAMGQSVYAVWYKYYDSPRVLF